MPKLTRIEKAPKTYFSEPFAKGLKILSLFNPEKKTLSLKEISDALDIKKSSAYRFTNTLVELGYLKKDPRTKLMSLGQKGYLLGQRLVKSFTPLDVVRPIINELYDRHQITIDSCLYENSQLVQLYFRAPDYSYNAVLKYHSFITNDVIHCSGLGKAILAYLPREEMLAIVDKVHAIGRTRKSITNKDALLADLEKTRQRGYAINDEEYVEGVFTIATPFFNLETGRPMGAVSLDFYSQRHTIEDVVRRYSGILLKLGKDISDVVQ